MRGPLQHKVSVFANKRGLNNELPFLNLGDPKQRSKISSFGLINLNVAFYIIHYGQKILNAAEEKAP